MPARFVQHQVRTVREEPALRIGQLQRRAEQRLDRPQRERVGLVTVGDGDEAAALGQCGHDPAVGRRVQSWAAAPP